MQRRLVSALEDLKLTADGTVRNTIGTVVQFRYGEDGVDPAKSVRGEAIDLDGIFTMVLGDDSDALLHVDTEDVGGDYGSLEKDEMEYYEEDSEFDEFMEEIDDFEDVGTDNM